MTEDVRYLAAFTLGARPVPTGIPAEAVDRLAAAIPGYVPRVWSAQSTALLSIDRPEGTSGTASLLLDGSLSGSLGTAEVLVGQTGLAALVLARSGADVLATEQRLEADLADVIANIAGATRTLVDAKLATPWPHGSIAAGQLLWWHRLIIADGPPAVAADALAFGADVTARGGLVGIVGAGFSLLVPAHAPMADLFVRGLFAATEEWFVVDEVDRRLRWWVRAIASDEASLGVARDEARSAAVDLVARQTAIEERTRYLVLGSRAVRDAARRAWGVDEEARSIASRLFEMRRLADEEGSRRQAIRDGRRNDLLFVFTLMAVLQTVFVLFDFVTGSEDQIVSALRLLLAGVVGVMALVLLLRAAAAGRAKH